MEREIDWSKPVEATYNGKEWFDVEAVMRNLDGTLWVDRIGDIHIIAFGDQGRQWVRHHNIRNKPEKLERWANVFEGGGVSTYTSKEAAERARAGCVRIAVRMVEADDD